MLTEYNLFCPDAVLLNTYVDSTLIFYYIYELKLSIFKTVSPQNMAVTLKIYCMKNPVKIAEKITAV